MELALDPAQQRVLGSLVEKQLTTPQHYPLTLNALLAACNQTSNRHPVVTYDDGVVMTAVDGLRAAGLARVVHQPGQRAAKYRHVLDEALSLHVEPLAVLCVLLLRGPQTVGELRTRTERMASFASLADVEATLDWLAGRETPLVRRMERRPGQKEPRTAHLLGGDPADQPVEEEVGPGGPAGVGGGTAGGSSLAARVADLEAAVAALRSEVRDLRAALGDTEP